MKIFTCLKEVPDRDTRYELNTEQNEIEEAGLTFEISECDEYALEESLKLREKYGGEVVILTVGRQGSQKSIRKGLAMGADRAIFINDKERKIFSPHATAKVLAEVLQSKKYDLILAGTQSDDLGYSQTGVILAEMLKLPYATIVMEVEIDLENNQVRALREMESGWFQWVQMSLPALLTIQAGISQVRYVSLKGIMQARKKEIRRIELEELIIDLEKLPSLKVGKLYFPNLGRKTEILQGDTNTAVKELIKKLNKVVGVN